MVEDTSNEGENDNGDVQGDQVQENGDMEMQTLTTETHQEERLEREGTIWSARFNLLSTMVGGGSLSLPLAFHQSGNAFGGPLFVILVAASAEFCFRVLLASDRLISVGPPDRYKKGNGSFESVASAAFGPRARLFSICLVFSLCFFGCVGYGVLLRDMLEPIADALVTPAPGSGSLTLSHNIAMLSVVLLVTPLCTLQTLTALRQFGAASMLSVLILGACVVYRSLQCNLGPGHSSDRHTVWLDFLTYFPRSAKELLDALPLFISCFVCHYNVLPVHNELQDPTPQRVSWWVRSTTWSAASFYLVIGFTGSMYGNCTPSGSVQGNVLLDFDEDDPLLLMGRLCLALTITLAFPMLIIPARDIIIRSLARPTASVAVTEERNDLGEPLLSEDRQEDTLSQEAVTADCSFARRLLVAIAVFWSGAAVACCVTSIDVVWDLLGSSLSILLSYLVPCASFIMLDRKASENEDDSTEDTWGRWLMRYTSWFLVILFTPLMFISTGNAVYNTFFATKI